MSSHNHFSLRIIACHKHPSSGRLHFLKFHSGDICGPAALPKLAVLSPDRPLVMPHPAAVTKQLADYLGLPTHHILPVADFSLCLEVPHKYAEGGLLPLLLMNVAGYQLPTPTPGDEWLEMADSFPLPYLQREILREAFRCLME